MFVNHNKIFGMIGFEPMTICSQNKHATGLRHIPHGQGGIRTHDAISISVFKTDTINRSITCPRNNLPIIFFFYDIRYAVVIYYGFEQ
jgi:hypothetical protein